MIDYDIYKKNILKNKNIIIAGATSGIGRSSARRIAKLGGNIILIGRDINKLENFFKTIKSNKTQNNSFYNCDLSDFNATYKTFVQINKDYENIHSLIWSAGSEMIKLSRLIDDSDVKNVFNVISNGIMGACKAFCNKKFWSDSGGSVVFLSSVSSIRSTEGMLLYSAAKSSLSGITKSLALELSKYNVRVNNVILGAIKTEMHDRITKFLSNESKESYEKKHLFGFGELDDVNSLLVYLVSDVSRWMTGSEVLLDGGLLSK